MSGRGDAAAGTRTTSQWLRFRPACNSTSTSEKTGVCALTKRSKSNGAVAVKSNLGPRSLGESKDVGGLLAEVPLPPEAPRHRHFDGKDRADENVDFLQIL